MPTAKRNPRTKAPAKSRSQPKSSSQDYDDENHIDLIDEGPAGGNAPSRQSAPPGPPQRSWEHGTAAPKRREVLIDGELFSLVEGDMVLDRDQIPLYEDAMRAQQAQHEANELAERAGFGETLINDLGMQSSALVGIMEAGQLVRWAPGTVLSYCVLRQTFPREEWYEQIAYEMRLATQAWEDTCGVEFEYLQQQDDSPSLRPDEVLFPVRFINAGGAFIAASFFPNDPPIRRRLLIDSSLFSTSFDSVGVLRHELGHTLGFRHEHIRSGAPRICPDEDTTGTFDLTAYDPQSVMHYFCGDVGSRDLEITELDRIGSQRVYGPPFGQFQLYDASL
jgi:hypothetical protein